MNFSDLEKAIESLIDWVIGSEPKEITNYINKLGSYNPEFTNKQIAEKIVNEQSINSGLLGAVTGLGGLITLPATIPIDLVKAYKIQAFTIRSIAYIYGYTPENTDSKTDIFLVLSNGSIEALKNLVIAEALNAAPKQALKAVDTLKKSAIQVAAKETPKYAAKALTKYGGKAVVNYSMKGISKHLAKALWKVGGRKMAEKALQKSIGKAVPVIGAVVGGGMDWFTTQAVGKLAIEYYENSVSDWVNEVFSLCKDNE
ncbi:EcsC family protein [Allocoleopsis sp.]|uniref:EcsC family protein n=1 Tax=Allocoleopsis sp. TaxID=3088169 RepID=UPI002FD51309